MYINNLITGSLTLGQGGSTPAIDPAKTRFTLEGGTVEEYDITETLDDNWMIDNGFYDYVDQSPDNDIDDSEFMLFKNIVNVQIGNTVQSIGSAFQNCINLTSITIPSTVTSIWEDTFNGCSGLTSVTFEGKDKATVQGMDNYPFGLNYSNENGVTVHCTNGDIQIQYE